MLCSIHVCKGDYSLGHGLHAGEWMGGFAGQRVGCTMHCRINVGTPCSSNLVPLQHLACNGRRAAAAAAWRWCCAAWPAARRGAGMARPATRRQNLEPQLEASRSACCSWSLVHQCRRAAARASVHRGLRAAGQARAHRGLPAAGQARAHRGLHPPPQGARPQHQGACSSAVEGVPARLSAGPRSQAFRLVPLVCAAAGSKKSLWPCGTSVLTWGGASCAVEGACTRPPWTQIPKSLYWAGAGWDEVWEIVHRVGARIRACTGAWGAQQACIHAQLKCPPPGSKGLQGACVHGHLRCHLGVMEVQGA